MDRSSHLALPFLYPSQADKHVCFNDAMRRLDVLVQLSVISASQLSPPENPTEGDRFLVPQNGTGTFADHGFEIAAFQDGYWRFYAPQNGWLVFVSDENSFYRWTNNATNSAYVPLPTKGEMGPKGDPAPFLESNLIDPNWAFTIRDSGQNILLGANPSGDIYARGITESITPLLPLASQIDGAFHDPTIAFAIRDNGGKILFGIRADDGQILGKLADNPSGTPNEANGLTHILIYGQSNGEGSQSIPPISTTSSGWGNYRFARGMRTWKETDRPTTPTQRANADFIFVSLSADMVGDLGETIATGVSDQWKASLCGGPYGPNNARSGAPHFLCSYAGRGGTYLSELSSENSAPDSRNHGARGSGSYWATMLDDIARAKAQAAANGFDYSVGALCYNQGERETSGTFYGWEAPNFYANGQIISIWNQKICAFTDELQTAVSAITGQTSPVPVLLAQTKSSITGQAQLNAAKAHPHIYVASPFWQMPSAANGKNAAGNWGDPIHLSADGQRWLGAQFGKVRAILAAGRDFHPLSPIRSKRLSATQLEVFFHVPVGPLVIDETTFPKAMGWGFKLIAGGVDNRGAGQYPTAIALGANNSIILSFPSAMPAQAILNAGETSHFPDLSFTLISKAAGPSNNGQATTAHMVAGDQTGALASLINQGCFLMRSATTSASAAIRAVNFDGTNTALIGENREIAGGGFSVGEVMMAARHYPIVNMRDSDSTIAASHWSAAFPAQYGRPYNLANWACFFDLEV